MENKFELAHVGIHNQSLEEAEDLSKTLCALFNLTGRRGKKSVFAGEYFECMREPYLGTHGHIAMRTADLDAAVEELRSKGFDFNMDTAAYGRRSWSSPPRGCWRSARIPAHLSAN